MSKSRSVGETYWVPESHWTLEMVGRGGTNDSGLKSLSWDLGSDCPVPHDPIMAISEGPVQPKMSPEVVIIVLEVLVLSNIVRRPTPSSLRPGIE